MRSRDFTPLGAQNTSAIPDATSVPNSPSITSNTMLMLDSLYADDLGPGVMGNSGFDRCEMILKVLLSY